MTLLTTAEAKTFLRVTTSDEDTLITAMIAAATEYAEQFLGFSFDDAYDTLADVPKAIILAIYQLVGTFYENRTTQVTGATANELYHVGKSLLWPYRWSQMV